MSRIIFTIQCEMDRKNACRVISGTLPGTRVEIKEARRTLDQNAKLWAMLTDISIQVPWHGIKLATQDWKDIFSAALQRELRTVPSLDGHGLVVLGRSTSDFSKEEMSQMIELMFAFGAEHGVIWKDPDIQSQERQLLAASR